MKQKLLASAMALAMVLSLTPVTALAAEDEATPETVPAVDVTATEEAAETTGITVSDGIIDSEAGNYTVPAGTANATITISGAVTLTGTGDAFTINADTTLVFEDNASLTLIGYTNGFAVSNATLSSDAQTGGDWDITDGSTTDGTGIDLFRLKTGGKLEINRDVTLTGDGKDNTESRAIVLESGSGQAVTLAAGTTLAANNFYRGLETGGASNYTISGAGMDSSTFNFQGNNVGMALSYFDEDANYEDCKLDVSNCDENGIFMRQDNAAIWGLYFDSVNIHCVNTNPTSGIAIRFHAGPFRFDNSVMTIDGSTTTGLWIYDGWDATRTDSGISNSTITVKNVPTSLFQPNGKAITMAICHDWTIDGSTIAVDNCGYAGINLSNDTRVSGSIFSGYTAVPGMVGGKLTVTDSVIHSSDMEEVNPNDETGSALFTVQVGQRLEFGDDVTAYNDDNDRPIVMCAKCSDPYPYFAGGFLPTKVDYNLNGLAENLKTDLRFTMTGGSSKDLATAEAAVERNKPVDENGTVLSMVPLSETEYNNLKNTDGTLTITVGEKSYTYHVSRAADDGNRYIWVPDGAVIGGGV